MTTTTSEWSARGEGSAPGEAEPRAATTARRVLIGVWAVILVVLLRHREVISSDTLSNYVHVWYIADRLYHGHGMPFTMPVLAHGDALAFPYGAIPWLFAVLLWPLMHEWSVGVTMGVGWGLMVGTMFWAFPELRKGWCSVAALVNPALVEALMLGQLPFMWASAMLLAAIGCWRRDRRGWATVLAALAQITHAAVLMPLVAVVVLGRYRYEERRRELLVRWAVSVAAALPAAALVLASPVTTSTNPLISLWIEIETVALRAFVIGVPFALLAAKRRGRVDWARWGAVGLLVYQVGFAPWSSMKVGWGALFRTPNAEAAAAPRAATFRPGATYRVLSQADGKYAPYAVVRAGGVLDSEFFPESMNWRSFHDDAAYARFLTERKIDFVVYYHRYSRRKTNEEALLMAAAERGDCSSGVAVTLAERQPAFDVYAVTRGCRPA